MKESNRQDFTLDDLDRLRQSELRPQEMIFAQIGDNGIYRPTLLALLSIPFVNILDCGEK
jgi:hypothetical protein